MSANKRGKLTPNIVPFGILFVFTFTGISAWAAKTPLSPEKQAARLGRILKPISDDNWKTIAGPRISEKYSVTKGDTLSDISKKLFGDPKYWPKIWAMNNQMIANPHVISPGFVIAFSPGSGGSLPSLSMDQGSAPVDSATDAVAPLQTSSTRSREWQLLPQQSWEIFKFALPTEVDPLGFDKSNKVAVKYVGGFEPHAIPASGSLPALGQIVGSRNESRYLTSGDIVFIRADDQIKVGETYSVTQNPTVLKSKKSDRTGYSYLSLGKVKILGVKDHLFLGALTTTQDFLMRGSFLIPEIKKIPELTPIPGPRAIPGILMVDHSFNIFTTSQHKEAFVDRGSDDGVQPGMVFRAYLHRDPSNSKKISNSNFVILGDFIVTEVSPLFCSVLGLQTLNGITEESPVVLLTDISDLQKNQGFNEKSAMEEDDLDTLDEKDGLTGAEKRELKQLEQWKKNPAPSPSGAPSPNPSALPEPGTIPTEPAATTPTDPSATPNPATASDPSTLGTPPTTPETTPAAEPVPATTDPTSTSASASASTSTSPDGAAASSAPAPATPDAGALAPQPDLADPTAAPASP